MLPAQLQARDRGVDLVFDELFVSRSQQRSAVTTNNAWDGIVESIRSHGMFLSNRCALFSTSGGIERNSDRRLGYKIMRRGDPERYKRNRQVPGPADLPRALLGPIT